MKAILFFIIGYLLILLRLTQSSSNVLIQLIPILYILFFLFKEFIFNPNRLFKSISKDKFPYIFLLTVVLIGSLRSNKPSVSILEILARVTILLTLILFLRITLQKVFNKKNQIISNDKVFFLVNIVPFIIFGVINLLLWSLGYEPFGKVANENPGNAIILSSFGIDVTRVQFPLGNGINNYSAVMGCILTYLLCSVFIIKKNITLSLIGILVLLPTILLVDSRSALLFPFAISIFLYFISKFNKANISKYIPLLTLLSPIIFVLFMVSLSQTGALDSISRGGEDIKTGNMRFIIWTAALSKLSDINFYSIVGYGEYGQYASGASKGWSGLLNMFEDSELTSSHNSVLTLVFDYGYIGLISFILLIKYVCKSINKHWNNNKNLCVFILSFLLYSLCMGTTESFFGCYNSNALYLFFTSLIFAFKFKDNDQIIVHINPELQNLKNQNLISIQV